MDKYNSPRPVSPESVHKLFAKQDSKDFGSFVLLKFLGAYSLLTDERPS